MNARLLKIVRTAEPVVPRGAREKSNLCPPFYTVSAISCVCNCTKAEATDLIDFGNILFAFNVATGPTLRDLRALPQCVFDYQAQRPCSLEWADVTKLLLPDNATTISGAELQRLLNIHSNQLARLIEMSELKPAIEARRGKGGSAQIETGSFVNFLKRRRV